MARTSIVEAIGPLLAHYDREEQPVFVAAGERLAAQRYRLWADEVSNGSDREALRSCATREEEIANRIDALHPCAADLHARIDRENPDLQDRYTSIFDGLSLPEQFAVQAEGERAGAATWRAFARDCTDEAHRKEYLACAQLEEQSAEILERLVALFTHDNTEDRR